MNKFYWKKIKDTTDPVILKHEVLLELKEEQRQAQYNNNWKRAAKLKQEIEKVEKSNG